VNNAFAGSVGGLAASGGVPGTVGYDAYWDNAGGDSLQPAVREEFSDDPVGNVIGMDPGPGASVDSGSTVTLVVSKGPKPGKDPDPTPSTSTTPPDEEKDEPVIPGLDGD